MDRFSKFRWIVWRHVHTSVAVEDNPAHPRQIRSNRGDACRCCFKCDKAEGFRSRRRWEHVNVRETIVARQRIVGHVPGKVNPVAKLACAGECFESWSQVAAADHKKAPRYIL